MLPSDDLTVPSDGPDASDVPPSASPAITDDEPDGSVGLRVVDRDTSDGLLGTIVGGVAGFFFGG